MNEIIIGLLTANLLKLYHYRNYFCALNDFALAQRAYSFEKNDLKCRIVSVHKTDSIKRRVVGYHRRKVSCKHKRIR